jgi:alkane 1-monooxygenase
MNDPLPPASTLVLPYRDRKRYAWLIALLIPGIALSGPVMTLLTQDVRMMWIYPVWVYAFMPALDWLLGEDLNNPPEIAVPQLDADPYYRRITYLLVPILWAAFVFCVWFFASQPLPWHGVLALVLTLGAVGGFGINLAHEMGHKNTKLERWLTQMVLALTGYAHFCIEHNRGHHRDVATFRDPASSRMGENIYAFLVREMPGALKRAWTLEAERVQRHGKSAWSLENDIIRYGLMTLVLWGVLVLWLGLTVLPFILAGSFWANFQLTSANYVEHYGLLRQERSPGRPEICQPHHSWNSNHIFTNLALLHLQRHSDHHAHPLRRYQSLRHVDHVPTLPSGYFGMFLLAYVPPLWSLVMNPRLLAVVNRDPRRINFQPGKRKKLMSRYQLIEAA